MTTSLQADILQEFQSAQQLLQTFISDQGNIRQIESAAVLMAEAVKAGGKIITCGNGGSHCDAMHFAEELTGKYRLSRRPIPALAVTEPAYLSCVGNDFGFEQVYSRYIEALGKPGDILLAISSSGNSMNIQQAVHKAVELNMRTVLLLGNEGGMMREQGDISIIVPYNGFADRIQEIHIKIIHAIIYCLERLV